MSKKAEKIGHLLKILSNNTRLLVLCHLKKKEMCVSDLEKLVSVSQSALSQHLAILREENMIKATKRQRQVYYRLSDKKLKKLLETLCDLY